MSKLIEFKCPACGGAMEFDSKSQKMSCPFCDTSMTLEEYEKNCRFTWDKESDHSWSQEEVENLSVFTCNSCGGEIVGDKNTGASMCPFCGNPVVMRGRFQGALRPDCVIPFKIDKEAAKAKYREHIRGKFLLPKSFASENHIDEIKGVYVPFWLFSSKVNAYARFEAEKIRVWSDSDYDYTEVKTYDVFRSGTMAFNNIPVDGSTVMPDDLMESIEPFDTKEAVPFEVAYLAGYFADKYDVDAEASELRASERLRQSTIEVLQDTIKKGYTSVRHYDQLLFRKKVNNGKYQDDFDKWNSPSSGVEMIEGSVKYALYPVWMLTSTYQGEKYTFAMNGQTGKFVGNLPMDKKKRNLTFAGVFAAASVISTMIASLILL